MYKVSLGVLLVIIVRHGECILMDVELCMIEDEELVNGLDYVDCLKSLLAERGFLVAYDTGLTSSMLG